MRILIIEDDEVFAQTLSDILRPSYSVDVTCSGEDGCLMANSGVYDLCIIDLYLPDMDGREVCKIIKGVNPRLSVIFMTGETKTPFKVSSLDSGADDYITKPFRAPELFARIRAVMRRTSGSLATSPSNYSYRDINMDPKDHECTINGRLLHLSKKEFDILFLLIRNNNKTVGRERLISSAWQKYEDVQSNVLDVYISRLRKKLHNDLEITAVYSHGYMAK
jgi:DNA-binding response OmpR family regulator